MNAGPRMRDAYAACFLAALTIVVSAGLMLAVALVPAPPAVLPLAVLACVSGPLAMASPLPRAIEILRVLRTLRRTLARLPETEHPLGL